MNSNGLSFWFVSCHFFIMFVHLLCLCNVFVVYLLCLFVFIPFGSCAFFACLVSLSIWLIHFGSSLWFVPWHVLLARLFGSSLSLVYIIHSFGSSIWLIHLACPFGLSVWFVPLAHPFNLSLWFVMLVVPISFCLWCLFICFGSSICCMGL